MIPDGDRRQAAQSGGVEHEVEAVGVRHHDVVRVLILNHDLLDHPARVAHEAPAHDVLERLPEAHEDLDVGGGRGIDRGSKQKGQEGHAKT